MIHYSRWVLLFLFLSLFATAKDKEFHSIRISHDYYQGNHLIYNCSVGHFACVDEYAFDLCRNNRQRAIVKGRENLECTPFKRFATIAKCIDFQIAKINHPAGHPYCFRLYDPISL